MRKTKTKQEAECIMIAVNIQYLQTLRHVTDERCAVACGFSVQTWHRRMSTPGKFTFEEIQQIANLLNSTSQRIMFGRLEAENIA